MALATVAAVRTAVAARIWDGPGGGMVFMLAVSPSRPGTVYAGSGRGGIFGSTDAGRSWRRLTRTRRPERVTALAVDRSNTIYAVDVDGRLLASPDGGDTWSVRGVEGISALAIDRRARPETVYAGTSTGAILSSTDHGRTWGRSGGGLDGQAVVALAVDPRRRRGVLWSGTTAGVFRSTDAGARWTKVASLAARRLVVDPTRRGTLFVVNGGVFRSADRGRSWRRLEPVRYALSMAIDSRTRPGRLFVGTSYTSVLTSTDGGEGWSPAAGGLPDLGEVLAMAVDSRTTPSTIYAALSGMEVYRSTDGGHTWLADDGGAAR